MSNIHTSYYRGVYVPYGGSSKRFLRERENVHSMRFREAVEMLKEDQIQKKIF